MSEKIYIQHHPEDIEDKSGEGGQEGGTSGRGGKGKREPLDSYLADDTDLMQREQRLLEQEGHRRHKQVKVRARERSVSPFAVAPEGELQNNILQHPKLNSQRLDGTDTNLNPEPPLNSEARREYDNAKRDQQLEQQLRLNNMPQFSSTPKLRRN